MFLWCLLMTLLKVNLLPESARKISLSPLEQFHRTPLMWWLVGLMVGLVLLALIPVALRGQRLHALNAKIRTLEPQKREVDQLQQSLQRLRAEEQAFRGIASGQSLWSKRLNILSNLTPEGVWFTQLSLDPDKGLLIQGSAVGKGDTEMVSIGRFVQDLKEDTYFSSGLKNIQIESIKRVQEKSIEIVQFTVTAALAGTPQS